MGLAVLGGGVPVAAAWSTKVLLDAVVAGERSRTVSALLALAVLALLVRVGPVADEYLGTELERRISYDVQDSLGRQVGSFTGIAVFEDPRFQDELLMAQNGGQAGPQQLVRLLTSAVQQLVSGVGLLLALLVVGPWLAVLVTVAALPGLWAELAVSRARVMSMHRTTGNERRRMFYGLLQVDVRAVKEIRLFGLGTFFHSRLLTELRVMQHAGRAVDRQMLWTQLGLSVLGGAAVAVAFVYTGVRALDGTFGVGDLAVVLAALTGVQASAAGLVSVLAQLAETLMLFDFYRRFVARPPDLTAPVAVMEVASLQEGLQLHGVWFRYRDDLPWILQDVDLTLAAGTVTALVGANGSGKSTLIKLLCRFYEPTLGKLTWDGVDLRDIDPESLRRRLGVVLQDYMEYELTALENIAIGDVTAGLTVENARPAALAAGVDGMVSALPKGYDTLLSRMFAGAADLAEGDGPDDDPQAGGVQLSGGQWQRLALARMFMRPRVDLFLVDEPSSALDADAEHELLQAFGRMIEGRTAVLVSHRLSTVRTADLIVVLDGGLVVERGRHDELVRAGGTYERMFTRQARPYL